MRLRDLGERKLTEQYLPTICASAGDDCAYVPFGENDIVVTTDPVPIPAARVIAGDLDLYWTGLLLVTINASDLAAAGAAPLAFLAAIELPSDTEESVFQALINGIRDGCNREGLKYAGGNLKESEIFAATGTAFGSVSRATGLHRKGARHGDIIYSVGQGGEFWRDVFRWQEGERFDKSTSKLFSPCSQLNAMQVLRKQIQIKCSMDNSDGLLSTLEQLARINALSVRIIPRQLSVPGVMDSVMSARYWLGWGDWNVIIGIAPEDCSRLEGIALANKFDAIRIGQFVLGSPSVFLESPRGLRDAPRLESERFASDSWFAEGIEGYISRLKTLDVG